MRSSTKKIGTRPEAFVLPRYDEIALVLQGGGALGAYQAGVYEGLAQVGVHPDWIAGVSIGALNTAIIAGNASLALSTRISSASVPRTVIVSSMNGNTPSQ
jgi:NTE family protein